MSNTERFSRCVDYGQITRIRARKSYAMWLKLYRQIALCKCKAEMLRYFYKTLDNRWYFGSEQKSDWSEESLEQVIKDLNKGE